MAPHMGHTQRAQTSRALSIEEATGHAMKYCGGWQTAIGPGFGLMGLGGGEVRATGGRLPAVLMRPTPQLSVKTRGGGERLFGGGRLEGVGGGFGRRGGFPRWGGLRATHHHMHTSWGMCVWGFGGMEVCMR